MLEFQRHRQVLVNGGSLPSSRPPEFLMRVARAS